MWDEADVVELQRWNRYYLQISGKKEMSKKISFLQLALVERVFANATTR